MILVDTQQSYVIITRPNPTEAISMHATEKLIEFVEQNQNTRSPKGLSCKYFKLDENWGIKVYKTEDERNWAAERQNEMHKHGFAPEVATSFNVGNLWCYVTENVKPLIDQEAVNADDYEEWCRAVSKFRTVRPTIDSEIKTLCIAMTDKVKSYYNSDRHLGNFGINKDGKLVCIDFGY